VTATFQPNFGTIFLRLEPWDERPGEKLHAKGIMAQLMAQFARIPDAIIFPFNIPTISGFGASAGFNFLIQDRSGSLSVERLGELSQQFAMAARQRPEIGNIFTSFDRATHRSRWNWTARRRASWVCPSTTPSKRWLLASAAPT